MDCSRKLLMLTLAAGLCFALAFAPPAAAERIVYDDSWSGAGFNLVSAESRGVEVVFSITEMYLEELVVQGQTMQMIHLPGVILPNDAGAPNLPGTGRYIALPEGATARVEILDSRVATFRDIDMLPAPPIPLDTDDSPTVYEKDMTIYTRNAYYPENPVMVSDEAELRGVDVVILGITPFQYNPVTKELLVYRDLRVRVTFEGGSGYFGEDRLRSRHWEPVLRSNLMNYSSLPQVNFNRMPLNNSDEDNVEYVIIVPDDPEFIAWADTIKQWRKKQGIITGITTLTEIGGNNASLIESYINNAYNSWTIAPVAFLLLSDYQNSGDIYGITSPVWNNYCVSDNILADINGDDLPDLAHARICAQNGSQLALMINKFLNYERTPPTSVNYYDQPLIAGGWQTDRWFIICCEIVYGFHANAMGRHPVRQYAGATGPPSSWSTNQNTYMLVNYFGPTGLNYIPTTPSHLTNWGGNATGINNAINSGAFYTLHRDHGSVTGWGHPSYSIGNLSGLNNSDLTFVLSINCLTGQYDGGQECFAEAFHRHTYGALGVIAASDISYSFVNDTYIFGLHDCMWPNFDPGYPAPDITGPDNLRPAFASASGKHYLAASSWPYNTQNKVHTYHLFHHHGDAFITLYDQVPQQLTVNHAGALLGGAPSFSVTANQDAVIALTVGGNIIGTAEGTGGPVEINIPAQSPGDTMLVTVTKYNYYRYEGRVPVIPPLGPYVIASGCQVVDTQGWLTNGQLDYDETVKLTLSMQNIGVASANNVRVLITSEDTLLTITDSTANYGTIAAGSTGTVPEGFEVSADALTPDEHIFIINVMAQGDSLWESSFALTGHAPVMALDHLEFNDPTGNNNNWLDPGETADMIVFLINEGTSPAVNLNSLITTNDPYLTLNSTTGNFGNIAAAGTGSATYNVTAAPNTPQEHIAPVNIGVQGLHGYLNQFQFDVMIGNRLYAPTGPDNYGYSAYDPFDTPECPQYDWVEICADSGGPGTLVNFTLDDQVLHYGLPFTFPYYGINYDSLTVATNGWIAPGIVTEEDYSNSGIPDPDGPPQMIAPYWEDLSPQRANSGRVWIYSDTRNHCVIVEYNHIEQYAPTGAFETFQVMLFDPAFHPTSTGDGRILFQYKDVSAALQAEGTIGIENHLENDGLEYFAGIEGETPRWDEHAHHITNEFAIMITTPAGGPSIAVTITPTNPPVSVPPAGGTFGYTVGINNVGQNPVTFDGWIETILPNGNVYGPLLLRTSLTIPGGASMQRTLNQTVPGMAPMGTYQYVANVGEHPGTVWSSDSFPFTKTGIDANSPIQGWAVSGWDDAEAAMTLAPDEYYLKQNSPNPFNPVTTIAFGLPESGNVELKIFNIGGRQVASLAEGWMEAGNHSITFNASALSSGVYFYQLKAEKFSQVKKMLMVK